MFSGRRFKRFLRNEQSLLFLSYNAVNNNSVVIKCRRHDRKFFVTEMESGLVKNIDITKCKIKLKKNLIKLGLNETPFLFNTKTSV